MAQQIISNAYFLINGVDLSDHVQSENFDQVVEQLEATAMGATTKITKPGLFDGQLKVVLFQDYATGKVDQTISPLLGVTTAVGDMQMCEVTIQLASPAVRQTS